MFKFIATPSRLENFFWEWVYTGYTVRPPNPIFSSQGVNPRSASGVRYNTCRTGFVERGEATKI